MELFECKNCGTKNNDINTFCTKCKTKFLHTKATLKSTNYLKAKLKEIEVFLAQDNIDLLKFKANYEILNNESREIYQATAKLRGEPDFSNYATSSIDQLASIIDRPLGYPNWFIAGYPDVVHWLSNLEEEKINRLFGDISGDEVLEKDNTFKIDFLRKVLDIYVETGDALECGITKTKTY